MPILWALKIAIFEKVLTSPVNGIVGGVVRTFLGLRMLIL